MAVFTKWKGVFKSTQKFIDSVKLYFGNDDDAYIDFDGTNFRAYPLTDTSGKIAASKIANGVVVEAMLGSGAVTSTKLGTGSVLEVYIGSGAVTAAKIGSGAVTSGKLGTGAVVEVYIGALAVTAGKIASDAVVTAKILDANVTTGKIADEAVTSVKQSNTITKVPKTASLTEQLAAADVGTVNVYVDNVYVYLPTYVGNSGLQYTVKVSAAFSSGVVVTGETDGGLIDGQGDLISTAIYDMLHVVCDGVAWHVVGKQGTWN